MSPNYNNIANVYDQISFWVFGNILMKSQTCLCKHIAPKSKILIVGGGTGKLLEEITKIHKSGLNITYVDSSVKMINKAKRRNIGENNIEYITIPIESYLPRFSFDIIITPFFLDNFNETAFIEIWNILHNNLKKGGLWLNADFNQPMKMYHKFLLKTMFLFFRFTCGVETKKLPDIKQHFNKYSYQLIEENKFNDNFISSVVYWKQ